MRTLRKTPNIAIWALINSNIIIIEVMTEQ